MAKYIPIICLLFVSCASQVEDEKLSFCHGYENSVTGINDEVLSKALIQAKSYSNKIYGRDCVVCAMVYDRNEKEFSILITSPGELEINTEAQITFLKENAKVISKGQSHSCYVKWSRK